MKEYREFPPQKNEPRFPIEEREEIARNPYPQEEYLFGLLDKVDAGMYRKEIKDGSVSIFDENDKRMFFTGLDEYRELERIRSQRNAEPKESKRKSDWH